MRKRKAGNKKLRSGGWWRPFTVCNDNVCHWWCLWHSVYCWGNSGETGAVTGLHHHGAILPEKVKTQLARTWKDYCHRQEEIVFSRFFSLREFPKAVLKNDTGLAQGL